MLPTLDLDMSKISKNVLMRTHEASLLEDSRAKPFIRWVGSKRSILPQIACKVPKKIDTYWEPFLGGGAVFFALEQRMTTAHLSDANSDSIAAFRAVRNYPSLLLVELENHKEKHSHAYFNSIRSKTPTSELSVASRTIYLNKTCFSGKYSVNKFGKFNNSFGYYNNPNIVEQNKIINASKALQKALIKSKDFEQITPGQGDFIYADPPYDNASDPYTKNGFSKQDQERLRNAVLRWLGCGANVLISNSNTEYIQSLYSQSPFSIHKVASPRKLNSMAKKTRRTEELLITT